MDNVKLALLANEYAQITDDESVSMQLLLGYIGLLNMVILAPVIPILVSYSCTSLV